MNWKAIVDFFAEGALLWAFFGGAIVTLFIVWLMARPCPQPTVVDFGADPSGVMDSTEAIQRAVNYAARTGEQANFGVGKYKTTKPIVGSGRGAP